MSRAGLPGTGAKAPRRGLWPSPLRVATRIIGPAANLRIFGDWGVRQRPEKPTREAGLPVTIFPLTGRFHAVELVY